MMLKILAIFALINFSTGRPQQDNDVLACEKFPNYECVPESQCKSKIADAAGEIFGEDFSLGIRQDDTRPEEAFCLNLDLRNPTGDPIVCCNKDDIERNSEINEPSCRCVNALQCSSTTTTATTSSSTEDDKVDPRRQESCPLGTQVCCPNDRIIKPKPCDSYAGFNCVQASKCSANPTNSPPSDATCFNRRFFASNPSICCHQEDVIEDSIPCESQSGYKCVKDGECQGANTKVLSNATCFDPRNGQVMTSMICCKKPEPKPEPQEQCSKYLRDGFSCVHRSECIDEVLSHSQAGLTVNLNHSIGSGYNPRAAACPTSDEVCCLKTLPPIRITSEKVCDRNPGGYGCRPLTECDLDQDILEDSGDSEVIEPEDPSDKDTLDIRQTLFVLNHEVSKCNKDIHVCCQPNKTKATTTVPEPEPPKERKCGTHNKNGLDIRVTQPTDKEFATQFGEWPHACLLYKINRFDNYEFIGGASLISPGVILTAAHKIANLARDKIMVRCGDWDITEDTELIASQERSIRTISIHPEYSGTKSSGGHNQLEFDFGLLHVTQEFQIEDNVNTICLPPFSNIRAQEYNQKNCVAMGWGKHQFGDQGIYQKSLKQVSMDIVDNDKCQSQLRATDRLSDSWTLHESFLCAGGEEGKDLCTGDGGGSLVCPMVRHPNRYVIAGIVAFGIRCGLKDVPGGYAAVSDGLCFIHYATKCQHGSEYQDYYNYPECDDWIDERIATLQRTGKTRFLDKLQDLKTECDLKIAQFERRIG